MFSGICRFVTWSDGSKQLLLGDEVLDIGELDNISANQFLFVRHTGPVRFIQVKSYRFSLSLSLTFIAILSS